MSPSSAGPRRSKASGAATTAGKGSAAAGHAGARDSARVSDGESVPLPDVAWLRSFRRRLLAWYRKHARTLPWRETPDPYRVWISEIMLQQTQVATVIPYFQRFLEALPSVQHLAEADEQRVLRLWEGLGYYRRARQLHAAAKVIVEQHAGQFPTQAETIAALPGIGRYTAAAIASIAFGRRAAILEANTRRLYARLLAYRGDLGSSAAQARLWEFAQHLLPHKDCGTFNQALMELGATICQPRAPQCEACPAASLCPTQALGLQAEIPHAARKVAVEEVREAAVIVRSPGGKVLVLRYEAGQRWAGLWDFVRFPVPERAANGNSATATPCDLPTELAREVHQRTGYRVDIEPRSIKQLKHAVTRYRITLDAYLAQLAASHVAPAKRASAIQQQHAEAAWVDVAHLDQLPLSTTGRKLAKLLEKL